MGIVTLTSFLQEPRVCVVSTLKAYLEKTEEIRPASEKALLITTTPPFGRASNATLARWTRATLANAGIDIAIFKANSVRGAAVSKLSALQVPVAEIMKKVSWKDESTFRKFYEKLLLPRDISHKVLANFLWRDPDSQ